MFYIPTYIIRHLITYLVSKGLPAFHPSLFLDKTSYLHSPFRYIQFYARAEPPFHPNHILSFRGLFADHSLLF